jgi:hypothetical protein
MKLTHLFTILLGIALCSASLLGDYKKCSETEIKDDHEVKECLDYGTTQLYEIAVKEKKVQDSNYERDDSATQVYKEPTSGGNAYTCKISVKNDYGDTVEGSCTVYYDQASGSKTVTDYSYAVKCKEEQTSTSDEGTYAPVDDDEVKSSHTIQECVNYGCKEVLEKAKGNQKISGSGYQITKINSVEQKTDSSGTYYKCNVDVTNYDDCAVTLDYNVYYQPTEQKKTLESYTYDVQKIAKQPQPTPSDYQELTPNQYDFQVNTEVQDCLNYGLESTLPNYEGYTVSTVNGVWKYDIPEKQGECYYKYEIGLNDNSNDKTATSSIIVYYNQNTQEKNLKAYSCKTKKNGYTSGGWSGSSTSSTYSKLSTSTVTSDSKYSSVLKYGVQECLKSLYSNNVISSTSGYTINGIKSALVKEDSGAETYKFRVSIKNDIGVSLQADYDVNYSVDSGEKAMTWYSVKGASPVNYGDVLIADYNANNQNQDDYEVDVGNYEKINPTDLNMYPDVQDTVDYGIQETVKQAAQSEGFSESGYQVKEIRNVCRDNDNSANYRADVTLTDSQGSNMDCSFSVNNENGHELTGYTYAVY